MSQSANEFGCFVHLMGGSGALAAPVLHDLWVADGRPFPMYLALLDTEPANKKFLDDRIVDAFIPVRLRYNEVQTVKATPWSFGEKVPRIVSEVADMLDPEELENG